MNRIFRFVWAGTRTIGAAIGIGARAFVVLVGIAGVTAAVANYTMTQGSGTTFGSIVVSTVHYAQMLVCDSVIPANCAKVQAGSSAATSDIAMTVADPNVLAAVNSGVITNGSAPPGTSIYMGANASGATGGLGQGIKQCDQSATYDASTNGSTLLKAGVSGRKFYICGWWFGAGGTATNIKLTEGTTTTTPCDTGTANVTPAFQLAANTQSGFNGPFWNGLGTATAADNLCINTSAGNAVQAIVWFTIQ